MIKKICVVTGGRADYGLLKNVIVEIKSSSKLKLQLAVTGMHLSKKYGFTVLEIKKDNFKIDAKVKMTLKSDSPIGITKSFASGVAGFSDVIHFLKPDLLLLLGDRYEILSAAIASMIARVPIAHIHGGETTFGSYDESIRHSITKMSSIHFVAANEYKKRVMQLGENPKNVHLVGGLGVDSISKVKTYSKKTIQNKLNISFGKKNLLVTLHPTTLRKHNENLEIDELLSALKFFPDINIFFTQPNSDVGNKYIHSKILRFISTRKNCWLFDSLGQKMYFSLLENIDAVVGNSSSGITEAPSFKKYTINIGNRQEGRLRSMGIIDVKVNSEDIKKSINKIYSKKLNKITNPYGKKGASKKIVNVLEKTLLKDIEKKIFFDLNK